MIARIRDRMDAFAQRFARLQSVVFLNVFYLLFVPLVNTYLELTGKTLQKSTGFFKTPEHSSNQLEDHLKQY